MESKTRGVLDTRRSLSSGAHSRDPVAGMTAECGARYMSYVIARSSCDEAIQLFPCGFWIASLALAMTVLYERNPTRVMPAQAGIQYSETSVMEAKTRGVLDTRLRGYDGVCR
jgi:hypothetical protein